MESFLNIVVETVALACELATVLVVALGAAEALIRLGMGWNKLSGQGINTPYS